MATEIVACASAPFMGGFSKTKGRDRLDEGISLPRALSAQSRDTPTLRDRTLTQKPMFGQQGSLQDVG
jgi:hypothetical protein